MNKNYTTPILLIVTSGILFIMYFTVYADKLVGYTKLPITASALLMLIVAVNILRARRTN